MYLVVGHIILVILKTKGSHKLEHVHFRYRKKHRSLDKIRSLNKEVQMEIKSVVTIPWSFENNGLKEAHVCGYSNPKQENNQ